MECYKISKNQSDIMKGIAILMMLVHHGFTFPHWIVETVYEPDLIFAAYFNSPTRLCVGIFAFLTGWVYALDGRHSLKESGNKLIKFLVTYWIVCIPSLLIANIFGGYRLEFVGVLTEMLGLSNEVMIFCWYVPFYMISMLLLPCIFKLWDKSLWEGIITGIILPIVVFIGLEILLRGTIYEMVFLNLKHWFPCIAVGYLCNRYNLYSISEKWTRKIPSILLFVVGVVFCGLGRYFISALDFVYSAILVFTISNCTKNKENMLSKALCNFGKISTNMWFVHCLIYNSFTGYIFQPIIYSSRSPLFVMFYLVLFLYLVSYIVTKLDSIVLKLLCK